MANPAVQSAEVFLRGEIEALGNALDVPLEGSLDSPSQAECLDCQLLEEQTLTNPEVRAQLAAYHCVVVGAGEEEVARRFSLPPAPAFVVLDRAGGWGRTVEGYRPPGPFLEVSALIFPVAISTS